MSNPQPLSRVPARAAIILATFAGLLIPSPARAQSVTLTINVAGPNPGTVFVSGNVGTCSTPSSTQCTFQIASGTVIRLTANTLPGEPVPGRFSLGTQSASACDLSTCSFTMTAASAVTATFNPVNTPTSTVTAAFAGDGKGAALFDGLAACQNFDPLQIGSCVTVYMRDSVVEVGAAPAAGSRFSGFSAGSGGATGCGAAMPCGFTLNSNATLTATFHALTSIAVAPLTAIRAVGDAQTFIANGTFSNGVTEQIPVGGLGTWRKKAPMPATKMSFGATVVNGRLYAIGGIDGPAPSGSGPGSIVRIYDAAANTWSTGTPMPTPREGLGVAAVNGLIYAVAGNTTGSAPVATVERYDPSGNAWIARAPLSAPRRFLATGVVNGIIYAVGGETASGAVATVEAYDPATDQWTTRAPMPTPRTMLAVGVVDGILYAVGGNATGGPALRTVEAYDAVTNTWTSRASMPSGATGLAVAAVGTTLYAMGGADNGALTSASQYDVVENAWNRKLSMTLHRNELAAAVIDGLVYAVGGQTTPGVNLPDLDALTESLTWTSSAPVIARATQQGVARATTVGGASIVASFGSLTCGTACGALTVSPAPVMSLDKTSLQFGATTNGSTFVQQTASQTVRLTQSGCCTVTWTATPAQPWITVSPSSGTGTTALTIGVKPDSSLPAGGSVSSLVTFAFTGASASSASVGVGLSIVLAGFSVAPAGAFETPLDNTTGLNGSIGVTGWAIDDVEVTRVRILRDPVAGETAGQLVFLGDAMFVDGARPDVAAAYPTLPRSTRAGWGYLLLTNFLPNQGNGTIRLVAIADDADGHSTLLGSKTIVCDNLGAVTPFGAIDTPAQGATVSGFVNNFGWVLSRGELRADPLHGGTVVAVIDGLVVGAPDGWSNRSDLAALFPAAQYSGIANAVGVLGLDTTTLTNGVHTIAWVVTDNAGGAAGVGSRYLTVSNGSGLTAETSPGRSDLAAASVLDTRALAGGRGYDLEAPLKWLTPDGSGRFTIAGEELDRFALDLSDPSAPGPAGYAGYLRGAADLGPLPIGSHLDQSTGIFTWQPGVAFVGSYDFVFVRSQGGTSTRRDVRIILQPKTSGHGRPQIAIDAPGTGEIALPFVIGGWAADLDARAGTGVSAVHVWALPIDAPGSPRFLGEAAYGGRRPDVADLYGQRYAGSGYGLAVQDLAPGTYDLAVFAWSTVTRGFVQARTVRVTVR